MGSLRFWGSVAFFTLGVYGVFADTARASAPSLQLQQTFESAWSQPWPKAAPKAPDSSGEREAAPPLRYRNSSFSPKATGIPHCDDNDTSNDHALIRYGDYTVVYRNCPPSPVDSIFGTWAIDGSAVYTIAWSHLDPNQVERYVVKETDPNGLVTEYEVAATVFAKSFDKASLGGPYGVYRYEVEACNAIGCNSYPQAYQWSVFTPAPAPVTQVQAHFVAGNEANLEFQVSWNHANTATVNHYWVERVTLQNGQPRYSQWHYVDGGTTLSWAQVPTQHYGDYIFQVWSCSIDNACAPADSVLLEQPVPSAPLYVDGDVTWAFVDEFFLQWPASPYKNTAYYKIIETKLTEPGVFREHISATTTSPIFLLLGEDGYFRYSVAACNDNDECTALGLPYEDWYVPEVPHDLTVEQLAPDQARVNWVWTGDTGNMRRFRVKTFEPTGEIGIPYYSQEISYQWFMWGPGAVPGFYTAGVFACRLDNPFDPPPTPGSTSPPLQEIIKYCTRESQRARFEIKDLTPDIPENLHASWQQKNQYQYHLYWDASFDPTVPTIRSEGWANYSRSPRSRPKAGSVKRPLPPISADYSPT